MHLCVCMCSVYRMDAHPDCCVPLLLLCVPADPPVLGCLLGRSVVLGFLLEHTLEVLYRLDGLDVLPLCSRDVEVDLATLGVANDHLTMLVQPDADPAAGKSEEDGSRMDERGEMRMTMMVSLLGRAYVVLDRSPRVRMIG